MRVDLTRMQVEAVVTMLRDEFADDDERLLLDTLEGETDLFEMVGRLLNWIEEDEGNAAALKTQIDDRSERKRRFDNRVATKREAITALLEIAGLDKLALPEATLSVRQLPAKLVVTDAAAVPDEYAVQVPKPNMDAIKSAFAPADDALPNWLRVEPPKPSLTIRRK